MPSIQEGGIQYLCCGCRPSCRQNCFQIVVGIGVFVARKLGNRQRKLHPVFPSSWSLPQLLTKLFPDCRQPSVFLSQENHALLPYVTKEAVIGIAVVVGMTGRGEWIFETVALLVLTHAKMKKTLFRFEKNDIIPAVALLSIRCYRQTYNCPI
jgi:hypothetical protein